MTEPGGGGEPGVEPADEPQPAAGDEPDPDAAGPAGEIEPGAPAPAGEFERGAGDEPERDETPAPPPAPSPFAALPTRPRGVVATALDALTSSSPDLRRASFYVGLVVLGLATPFALLAWRFAIDPALLLPVDVEGAWGVALLVALLGVVVATIEGRAVAVTVLAARLSGRSLPLRDAVQRSRTVFWRMVGVLILTNVPLLLVQGWLDGLAAELFGGDTEASVFLVAIVIAIAFSPLAYVVTGVVLGDVGPWTAVRRSVRLFRARKTTAVVVALFELGAQFLTLFGLSAAVDLVARGAEASGLSAMGEIGSAVTIAGVVVLLFAAGTLLLTVAAISTAPQVVAFLGLTHVAPGLDRIGGEGSRFRWLTRSMLVTMAIGAIAMFGGLSAFS